ncbi:DegV family protein [Lactovum odontotermitis]
MTFQIMTDATADLPIEVIEKDQLVEFDMSIVIDEKPFTTVGENRITSDQLLAEMVKGARAVTTAVGTGEAEEKFREYAEKGVEVLYLTFSSGLSGTFQSAVIARESVMEAIPTAKIAVVDSLAAASGEGYLLEEVVKWRDEGKTVEEIVELLKTLIPRVRSWFMVDDLHFLARGGRIPKAAAVFGTMANIKPVLDVDPTGHLRSVSKARGTKKALSTLIENTLTGIDDANYPRIIVSYSGQSDLAETAKEEFLKALPDITVDIRPLGPVISAHTGPGTVAIFSVAKTERQ